ncbi:MAG: alpha/beta hydrolase [Leifsonia sp.]
MKLAVHETGTGPRTAVLVHGIMSDHRAWHRVGQELVEQGFRIIAVDLAGHGRSPRSRRYSPAAWADDVVETVQPLLTRRPDLIMGHSLGALVASLVGDRLAPRAAVYVDPAFAFPGGLRGVVMKLLFAIAPRPRRAALVRWNPKWSATDIDIELATLRDWDKRTILGLASTRGLVPPARLVAPSLVVLAERSLLITDAVAARLRALGMTVERVAGTGHMVFRDEHARFMEVVDRWLPAALVPARQGR